MFSPEPKKNNDQEKLLNVDVVVIILKDVIWEIEVESFMSEIAASTMKARVSDDDIWSEGGKKDDGDSIIMRKETSTPLKVRLDNIRYLYTSMSGK